MASHFILKHFNILRKVLNEFGFSSSFFIMCVMLYLKSDDRFLITKKVYVTSSLSLCAIIRFLIRDTSTFFVLRKKETRTADENTNKFHDILFVVITVVKVEKLLHEQRRRRRKHSMRYACVCVFCKCHDFLPSFRTIRIIVLRGLYTENYEWIRKKGRKRERT